MPNVKIIQGIFICYNISKFQDPRPFMHIGSSVFARAHAHTHTHTHTSLADTCLKSGVKIGLHAPKGKLSPIPLGFSHCNIMDG